MSEFAGLWKSETNQHALVHPKMECGCPSGRGIKKRSHTLPFLWRKAEEEEVFDHSPMCCGKIVTWWCVSMLLLFQSELEFQGMINKINAGRPQCPVGLNTLVLPSKGSLNLHEKHPYVYLACGHVHGKHEWGQGDSENRTCPLCMEVGQVAIIV